MAETIKYLLDESRIPKAWYNIMADLPSLPPPVLHPGTMKPVGPDDLAPLFPTSLIMQEVTTEREVAIPEPVREIPFKPSRMIHFFDASNEKMRAKVPDMAKSADILLGNLEDAIPVDDIVTIGNDMTDFRATKRESSPLSTTFSTTSLLVTIPTARPSLVTMTDSSFCDCICSTAVATVALSSRATNCLCMYDVAGLSRMSCIIRRVD